MINEDLVTAIVLTSPVPSNPSPLIIDETLNSIRHWFKDAPLLVLADGVREEQKEMAENYRLFLESLMDKWHTKGAFVYLYAKHLHQIGMMRHMLKSIQTPLILFCEHDTPIVTDRWIDWQGIIAAIMRKKVDFVRFLPEPQIHPEHEHLMQGQLEGQIPLMKTIQFSARPHLASKDFYYRVLQCFSPEANSFIEDKMHSVCQDAPWEDWKMTIYNPPGNAQRSYHLDGRAGANKFDGTQVF